MNPRLLILIAFLSFLSTKTFSQNISPEDKQKYIGYMDSSYVPFVQEALWEIEEKRVVEAIPALERNIWRLPPYEQFWCVRAMWRLGSSKTLAFAKALIDTINARGDEGTGTLSDPLILKVETTEILLDLGDYSTVPYVFELLRRDTTSSDLIAVDVLKSIILKVPAYADSAKNHLIKAATYHSRDRLRWMALSDLIEVYGSQMNDLLVRVATTDHELDNRVLALRNLIAFNHPQIKELLYRRLYEEEQVYRSFIADTLLFKYGTPQDYQVVKQYLSWEPDTMNRRWINYTINNFKPPVPSATTPVAILLDTLISYKHQVFVLGWLGDKNFVNELDNHLENARKHLVKGDSVNCRKEVEKFQEKVQKEYEKTVDNEKKNKPRDKRFVTVEAWKFLSHHAGYILERLPRERKPK